MSIIFGLICGIALGLTGGGGSILAVPMLIYGLGLSYSQAITTSLLVVGLTAISGIIPKLKTNEINFTLAITIAIFGFIFAPTGSYLSLKINSNILLTSFSIFMIIVGLLSYFKDSLMKSESKVCACVILDGKLILNTKCIVSLALISTVIGLLTGLFGVGGGFLIVPALLFVTNMPIKNAISTSLVVVFLVSSIAFISHIFSTHINITISILFILCGIVGMFSAMRIKDKINDKMLQRIFALMLIIIGIITLVI